MRNISILLLLLVARATTTQAENGTLPVLGVSFQEGEDKFYAAIGALSLTGGNVSFANQSADYQIDSQLQPCINARFTLDSEENARDYYAIQTMRDGQSAFDVIDQTGTVSRQNYSLDGQVISYLVVAWAWSPVDQRLISIGWSLEEGVGKRSVTAPSSLLSHQEVKGPWVVGGKRSQKDAGPQVAAIDPTTGVIEVLTDVPGYAFLECAAVISNGWFHYFWLDYDNTQYTGSLSLSSHEFHAVRVPDIFGLVLNLASFPGLGSSLVASTEHGLVALVQPEMGILTDPYAMFKAAEGQVALGASTMVGGQLLTLLKATSGLRLATTTNHTTKYVDVDAGDYSVFLGNF